MAALTRQACQISPEIRELALNLATSFGVRDILDACSSIVLYARTHFIFVDEPEELLIDPLEQFRQLNERGLVRGDCDDVSMFIACLTYCLGLQTRFKAIQQGSDGTFQHVFVEVYIPQIDNWIVLDATLRADQNLWHEPGDFVIENV